MEFTVQVEKPSNIVRKLKIRVAADTVLKRYEQGLAEVQRTAKLKGFRPGQVPITIVKQYYGDDVRHRVFHNLIDESYHAAVVKENIQAVGSPKIETPEHKTGEGAHDHGLKEGADLTFEATVEVVPEIEVKGYSGLSVTEEKVAVTDQDVEVVIKGMLDSHAQLIPASSGLVGADGAQSSRPVRKTDYVDMKFAGGIVSESGVEMRDDMKGNRVVEIGSNALIPGFEDQLEGMRAGETKTFRVTFPKEFQDAETAGKDAEFTVTINEVKEKKVPEFNAEFCKELGYESPDDLRAKAKEHLTRERGEEVQRKLRSDLLSALIDKNPFDVPQSLVQAQARALAQDVGQRLKSEGFDEAMIQQTLQGELPGLLKRAENQVRASLLLEAVAKKESIAVTPDELQAEIGKLAQSMKAEEEKLREYYDKNPNRLADLEFRMREDRVVKYLFEKAKIKKA